MKKRFAEFIYSMEVQLSPDAASYKRFITEETYINGKKFSFKDHEYQEYIVDVVEKNPGYTFSVMKCSQIGLSEVFNRLILARAATRPGTSVLVSFPSISFSQEVFKTRMTQVINSSPKLSSLIDRNNDSASVKSFHNESIMYALGGSAQSKTSLLNRPIDTVLVDEKDRQDPKITSGYRSRMTHTSPEERLVINISTPTADGIGIDAEIKESGQIHTPWMVCPCDHEFIPDFYQDVVIPGFNEKMLLLTKNKAAKLDLTKSYLKCPECGQEINKDNRRTKWKVRYNEEGVRKKIGIVIDPFTAMGFISIPDLVESSLEYDSHVEFLNQGLGKTADKADSSLTASDIIFTHDDCRGSNIFGLDLGKTCHWMRGILKPDSTVHVAEARTVNLSELEDFVSEQHSKYIFSAGVVDSQPYTDVVYKMIKRYNRMFSAIYVSPNIPIPEMYKIKMTDKNNEVVRQISINKSVVMDTFSNSLSDFYTFESGVYDAAILKHFLDMRRIRDYRFEEMIYKWVKSDKGDDHFWHTAVYLFMASKLAIAGFNSGCSVPIVVRKMNVEAARQRLNKRR